MEFYLTLMIILVIWLFPGFILGYILETIHGISNSKYKEENTTYRKFYLFLMYPMSKIIEISLSLTFKIITGLVNLIPDGKKKE